MQFVMLVASIILILWYVCNGLDGGIAELLRVGSEHEKFKLVNFDLSLTVRLTVWGVMVGQFTAFMAQKGIDQVNAQLYMAGQSAKVARRSLMIAPFFSMTIGTMLFLIGAGFYVYYLQHPSEQVTAFLEQGDHDKILPFFVVY